MQPVDYYLDEYGKDHQNPVNKNLHRICVPAIVVSLLGLLWAMPVPDAFAGDRPLRTGRRCIHRAGDDLLHGCCRHVSRSACCRSS